MREIAVEIEFKSPCLGAVRVADGPVRFDRAGDDIMLPPMAWPRALEDAAKHAGMPRDLVARIRVDACVRRKPDVFKRYYKLDRYTMHEALLSGTRIQVLAMVPQEISDAQFARLMTITGRYCGVSPYGWGKIGFGRFDVKAIGPRIEGSPDNVQAPDA